MSEQYVTMAEVRELLLERQEKGELRDFQKTSLDHAQTVSSLSAEGAKALVAELSQFADMGITDSIAMKIADILPQEPVDIRAILSKERVTLDSETTDKILEIVLNYL
jgi:DNA-directed RNA polymerase subunit F